MANLEAQKALWEGRLHDARYDPIYVLERLKNVDMKMYNRNVAQGHTGPGGPTANQAREFYKVNYMPQWDTAQASLKAGQATTIPAPASMHPLFAATIPPPPHQDASNQALGPNLGGRDGIVDVPQGGPRPSTPPTGNLGSMLLIGGVALLVLLAFKRK